MSNTYTQRRLSRLHNSLKASGWTQVEDSRIPYNRYLWQKKSFKLETGMYINKLSDSLRLRAPKKIPMNIPLEHILDALDAFECGEKYKL